MTDSLVLFICFFFILLLFADSCYNLHEYSVLLLILFISFNNFVNLTVILLLYNVLKLMFLKYFVHQFL